MPSCVRDREIPGNFSKLVGVWYLSNLILNVAGSWAAQGLFVTGTGWVCQVCCNPCVVYKVVVSMTRLSQDLYLTHVCERDLCMCMYVYVPHAHVSRAGEHTATQIMTQ